MAGLRKRESPSFDRLLFAGLTDKEIISLYNVGMVRTLEPLERLVQEGEPDPSAYLVTGGSLRVFRKTGGGADLEVTALSRGAWFGSGPDSRNVPSSFSVISSEHTTLLCLDKSSFDMLGGGIKSFVRQALASSNHLLVERLAGERGLWEQKANGLTAYLTRSRSEAAENYPRIEIVQDLLREIPRLPLFVDKLTSMLLSDSVSTAEVVEYAKTDPSIVSSTLRRINSPHYNLREKITDFHRAIMLLGFNQIYQIALEECVFELFPKSFRTREFHLHSILIALIGFELTTLTAKEKPTAVSTIGLIHDLGLVLIQILKNRNRDIAHLIGRLDGAHIAAMLFEKWSFPQSICGTIRYLPYADFTRPEGLPEEFRRPVALLHVSHLLGEYMQYQPETGQPPVFARDYMDYLGFGGRTAKEVADTTIYPLLSKRIHLLPEDIRNLLTRNLGLPN